jgi:hypothetical protein
LLTVTDSSGAVMAFSAVTMISPATAASSSSTLIVSVISPVSVSFSSRVCIWAISKVTV